MSSEPSGADFEHPPDVVARPRTEDEVVSVLDWAMGSGAAVIPFGGGTSVVGRVEPVVDSVRYTGVVTIDLKALDQVLEVDSHSARIQGGATGPGWVWEPPAESSGSPGEDSVGTWREAFVRAPYLRDTFVAVGMLSETFETAITWDRFPGLHEAVLERTLAAVGEVCGAGSVTCRFTHVYPDGPAAYCTVLAPAERGAELAQWAVIKWAAADAVLAGGGTITHHHAVGRDHRPWCDRQRPQPFRAALRGAQAAADPAGAMNPGVLVDLTSMLSRRPPCQPPYSALRRSPLK